MKIKLAILILLSILLTTCAPKDLSTEVKEADINTRVINGETYEYKNSIKYIKGKKTHLCFVRVDNNEIDPTSGIITCVPCDSLKNVSVEEVEGI